MFQAEYGTYPTANNCPIPGSSEICLNASSNNTYGYGANNTANPPVYCLSSVNGNQGYVTTSTHDETVMGGCPSYNGLLAHLDVGLKISYPGSGTTWSDISSNSNNGTLVNGVGYTSANGGALVYDGVNDYVSIGNNLGNAITTSATFEAWVYSNNDSNFRIIAKNWVNNGSFLLYRMNKEINFALKNSSGVRLDIYSSTGGNAVATGAWKYIAGTWDGTTMRAYSNGVQVGSGSFSGDLSAPAATYVGEQVMNGKIGVVSFHNRALTATEIQQNFNAFRGRYGL